MWEKVSEMEIKRFEQLCEARKVLCTFCENKEACDYCQITLLIDQAYIERESNSEGIDEE